VDDPRAVLPVFLAPSDRPAFVEQVASGVLLALGGETFVLTASHVVDELDRGSLMFPVSGHLLEFGGTFHRVPVADGASRGNDRTDFGFLRLKPELAAALHPDLEPLGWEDLGFFETLVEGDLYTFVGYPANRARVGGQKAESELFKYTGAAASDAVYQEIGFDPGMHIAMMFDVKRCFVGGRIQATAHPPGLSGGAIVSWPKTARELPVERRPRRLVGIAHTYLRRPGCMVGTRINGCVAAILHHYPELDPCRDRPESIPLAMVWYREADWPAIKRDFADGANMHATFNEWREAAQTGIESLRRRGVEAVPVHLSLDEIARYCAKTGQPNTGRTRGQLASRRLAQAIRGRPLTP
jgi:hypothetical protein